MRRRPDPRVTQTTMANEAMAKLARKNLRLPKQPRDEMPELRPDDDLGEWSDHDVIAEMTTYTRWADYLTVQVALAVTSEETAERFYRRTRDLKMIEVDAPKGQVQRAKAEAGLSDEVVEAEDVYAEARAYRKLIEGLYENVTRGAALLSRELTRRTEREGPERRDRRWGGA